MEFLELLLHTDDYLTSLVETNLWTAYLILFLIIFAESGSVFFPFLPGDGLLFSAGVVASATALNFQILLPLLMLAAILGFLLNYKTGAWVGVRLLNKGHPLFLRYYTQTKTFLDKYGMYSVLICRFFPILRTYLPFVAGVVGMDYRFFLKYTIIGAVLWVWTFTTTGYLLGKIPWVSENYGLIFLGLIFLTIIPFLIAFLRTAWNKLWPSKTRKKN